MSTCAVLLVRDEADIIESSIRHLLFHADEVLVADHHSIDGTREILAGLPITVTDITDPGYRQAEITNRLAQDALARGHEWVLPVDADEFWHPAAGQEFRIADLLRHLSPGVLLARVALYDRVATSEDYPGQPDPVRRLWWRRTKNGTWKIACRLRPDLMIAPGNHSAMFGEVPSEAPPILVGHHFHYRDDAQYLKKIRNGLDSYGVAAGMPPGFDYGWAQWKDKTDAERVEHMRSLFFCAHPQQDPGLTLDPFTPA